MWSVRGTMSSQQRQELMGMNGYPTVFALEALEIR